MRESVARWGRRLATIAASPERERLVLGAGVLLVLVQLGFRAWALYPSWFYGDDYILLLRAERGLDLGYVLEPHNGHLMPAGRLLVWLVLESGTLNWPLVATTTLLFQALASVAALWMLVVLFGRRWAILATLGIYLFGVLTLPALMWWAATLNQMATQVGFFVAVGSWVLYLRGAGNRWLALTVAAVAFGLAFDVKAMLILPVLVFVLLAYFSSGRLLHRCVVVVRSHRVAAAVLGVGAVAYLAYYVVAVDSPFTAVGAATARQTASTMLGTAFVSAAAGGPWDWTAQFAPNATADPPEVAVHLAWVLCVLVVLYGALRRRRSLRAWGLLLGYLLALLALLVTSRVAAYGATLGLQYRFLTDAGCTLTLALGLAFLPLYGAVESSEARAEPLLRLPLPRLVTVALVVLLALSETLSSVRYVSFWHHQNPSSPYVATLRTALADRGAVDVADLAVPEGVVDPLRAPDNQLSRFVTLLPNEARFPRATADLQVVDGLGQLRPALIKQGLHSVPGPQPGCGWRLTSPGGDVPLTGGAFDYPWWLRIGYLSSTASPVTVSAGGTAVQTHVRAGLHSLFVKIDGGFSSVRVDGLATGTTLCVDTIEVGDAVPQEGR